MRKNDCKKTQNKQKNDNKQTNSKIAKRGEKERKGTLNFFLKSQYLFNMCFHPIMSNTACVLFSLPAPCALVSNKYLV